MDQNQLEAFVLNNIVKILKYNPQIAKINMNFGGRLSHEFATIFKKISINVPNALT